MNKTELIEAVAAAHDLPKSVTRVVIDAAFEKIAETLVSGEEVRVPDFGIFRANYQPEHPGINPKTLERITAPASRRLSFKPSKVLKEKVSENLR